MTVDPRPIWWRTVDGPPPTPRVDIFDAFTGQDTAHEWGLAAGIYIAGVRRRTGKGPTFSELFWELLPESGGVPSPLPDGLEHAQRRKLISDFRLHAATEWRRRGWISWKKDVPRSLQMGPVFREHARQYRRDKDPRSRTASEI